MLFTNSATEEVNSRKGFLQIKYNNNTYENYTKNTIINIINRKYITLISKKGKNSSISHLDKHIHQNVGPISVRISCRFNGALLLCAIAHITLSNV